MSKKKLARTIVEAKRETSVLTFAISHFAQFQVSSNYELIILQVFPMKNKLKTNTHTHTHTYYCTYVPTKVFYFSVFTLFIVHCLWYFMGLCFILDALTPSLFLCLSHYFFDISLKKSVCSFRVD